MGESAQNLSSPTPQSPSTLSPRQTFLLIATALVLAALGVTLLEFGGGDDLGIPVEGEKNTVARDAAEDGGGGHTIPLQGHADKTGTQPAKRTGPDPANIDPDATSGIIDGRIALDTSIVNQLHTYTIEVSEEINENAIQEGGRQPFRKAQRFAYDQIGTPFFTMKDIPFSRYGYLVRLYVARLNGSQARVHITRDRPYGEVQLSVTPGVIFSVLLRDQRQTPRPDLYVQMIPQGNPPERPVYRGTSNNYGQVLFENVVKGDYKIFVGRLNSPMNVPENITVLPVNAVFSKSGDNKVSTQSTIVLVPSGAPVTVEVVDRYGYGIADAELEMHQIEVTRYFPYKGKTGEAGRHVFDHLPVGKYQLSVHKPGFGRRTQKLEIKAEDRQKVERVQLRRL